MRGTSLSGPSEQLTPTAEAPAAANVTAQASGEAPRKVRPSSPKVMVHTMGMSTCSFMAMRAVLASSRSPMVSMITRSASVAAMASPCSR